MMSVSLRRSGESMYDEGSGTSEERAKKWTRREEPDSTVKETLRTEGV